MCWSIIDLMFTENNLSCSSFSSWGILHTAITITIHFGNWIYTTWGLFVRRDNTSRDSVHSFHLNFLQLKRNYNSLFPLPWILFPFSHYSLVLGSLGQMETHKAEEGFTVFSYGKRSLDAFGPSGCIWVSPVEFTEGGGVQELFYSD